MRPVREEEFILVGESAGDFADLVGVNAAIGGEAVEAKDSKFVGHNDCSDSTGFGGSWERLRGRYGNEIQVGRSVELSVGDALGHTVCILLRMFC